MADVMMKVEASNIFSVKALSAALPSPKNERIWGSAPNDRSHDPWLQMAVYDPTYASHHDSASDFPRMQDVMMEEVEDSDSFSVKALAAALPWPKKESSATTDTWPVYDPTYVSHEPVQLTSPCFYHFSPAEQQEIEARSYSSYTYASGYTPVIPNYAPPPPGRIDPGATFYGPLEEQDSVWHEEMGILGRIGLHCYNLRKGTNLQFSGLYDSTYTGVFSHHITSAAKDPMRNSNCKFESNVWFRKKNDCLIVHTSRCRMVLPAPDDDYMGTYEGNHEAELGMPDKWLPKDALTGGNKLQYYEMKESEVEQEKEWLLLYAEFALFSNCRNLASRALELGKVIVQTREVVESKAKAKNAIFYISFKIAGLGLVKYNGTIRRATDGGPDRFCHEAKCFMVSSDDV